MGFGSGGEGFTPGRNNLVGNFTVEGQISGSLGITGSSFTGDGSGLTNVGGGSLTLTIGNSIATGTSNSVLYQDSSNELAESANLTFNGTTLTVATLDANGGAIDDVTVGATTPSSVRATTLSGSGILKVVGAAQFGNTLAATGSLSSSVGLSGSAVKADGVISGSVGSYSSLLSNTTVRALTGLTGSSAKISGDVSGSVMITRDLTLDGTAVSSTAAELNLLDGIAAVTISGVSLGGTLGALSKATNSGLALTSYDGSAAVSDLAINLHDLSAAAVTVASDSIAIIDGDDNSSKKESIEDLATAMASTGLAATSGQLGVDGVLEDLDTLGAASTDGEIIVATGAGAFAYETGATLRTSIGVAIGSNVQAYDADLDTLSGMQSGAPGALALLTQTEIEILDGATVTSAEVNLLDASVVTEPGPGAWASLTRWAKAEYDFDISGGAVSAIGLGVTIPDNAIITGGFVDVLTGFTSGTTAATVAIGVQSAVDIVAATQIDTLTYDSAGVKSVVPAGTGATAVKVDDGSGKVITLTIGVEVLTAGKANVWLQYVISE